MTVNYFKIGPAFDLKDLSPFCIKLETYFKLANIDYNSFSGNPQIAPKGKLPYIEHNGKLIGDSSLIIDYCKNYFGDILDANLTTEEQIRSLAFKSMIEEHLYFVEIYFRWQQPSGWKTLKPVLMDVIHTNMQIPKFLTPLVAKSIRRKLLQACYHQGMGRHSSEEVILIGKQIVKAIAESLSENKYFLANIPHSIDATVFAFVESLLKCPVNSPVADYARKFDSLHNYVKNINYFNDNKSTDFTANMPIEHKQINSSLTPIGSIH